MATNHQPKNMDTRPKIRAGTSASEAPSAPHYHRLFFFFSFYNLFVNSLLSQTTTPQSSGECRSEATDSKENNRSPQSQTDAQQWAVPKTGKHPTMGYTNLTTDIGRYWEITPRLQRTLTSENSKAGGNQVSWPRTQPVVKQGPERYGRKPPPSGR